jgi:hypothetical protein
MSDQQDFLITNSTITQTPKHELKQPSNTGWPCRAEPAGQGLHHPDPQSAVLPGASAAGDRQ